MTSTQKPEGPAAAAAALATSPSKSKSKSSGHPLLDEDGKLSSAGAAASLKYAKAQDLPSFPSTGLKLSSAGAAASLADSNKSSFEHWKPGAIPAANKAAVLAKDYEMDPLWQPEMSAAGSKAALLAHRDNAGVELWSPTASKEGQSAAGQALRQKPAAKYTDRDVPADAHRKALMAATGAMAGSRQRAGSAPMKPAADNSWAMKAANHSHKDAPVSQPFASGDPGFEAARIQNVPKGKVNRSLYGSSPPVDIEVQEKNRQDTLRASAVAMAQKMYAIQQKHIDEATSAGRGDSRAAANSSHRRNLSQDSDEEDEEAPVGSKYENLEEAARKLAQERLAKLEDKHAEYRQYYGASPPQQRSRMSSRLSRRRASTGDESDEEQSRKIRQQMSMFQAKLSEVDKTKRQADRDALLQAAHRNVEARLAKMDQQIYQDTGKASPAQKEAWEKEAKLRAQERVTLASQNVGKVHIGGGKYLDQAEIDAIARARLQPTLDDITDKAEKQRARDEEIRLEQERAKAQAEKEKAREAEIKAETKAANEREKQEQRARRDEEKRTQKEQATAEKEKARLEKEERRKSKDIKSGRFSSMLNRSGGNNNEATAASPSLTVPTAVGAESTAVTPTVAGPVLGSTPPEGDTVHDQVTKPTATSEQRKSVEIVAQDDSKTPAVTVPAAVAPTVGVPGTVETSTSMPTERRDSKVKSWFKTRLRGSSKTQKDEPSAVPKVSTDQTRDGSIRDVAMAGRPHEAEDMYSSSTAAPENLHQAATTKATAGAVRQDSTTRSSSVSSLSVSDDDVPRGRRRVEKSEPDSGIKNKLFKRIRPDKDEDKSTKVESASSNAVHKDSNTTDEDEFEEARDAFEEKLSPPAAAGASERPRSSHAESRFTEQL